MDIGTDHSKKTSKVLSAVIIVLAVMAGLYLLSWHHSLLFHFIIEFASIVIGICIFLITVHTSYLSKNAFMIFLGAGLFTSSLFDLLRTLSYQGLNIFIGFDADLHTQLWVSARFLQIAGIIIASFLISRLLTRKMVFFTVSFYVLWMTALLLTIFVWNVFPERYIEGHGLTVFKIAAGLTFSAGALAAIVLYYRKKEQIGKRNFIWIMIALVFFILSELSFTLYVDVYGFFNMLGHVFKLASYVFFYIFFIANNLRDPFAILFQNLKRANEKLAYVASHDSLTGFLNQSAVFEAMKNQYKVAKRFEKPFSVIMLDIDDFKAINDRQGHPAGDEALKFLARVIDSTVREVDIKGRYGGDEFIISPIEADATNAFAIAQKIQESLSRTPRPQDAPFDPFQISLGVSGLKEGIGFDEIIMNADKALLQSKQAGKNRVTLFH